MQFFLDMSVYLKIQRQIKLGYLSQEIRCTYPTRRSQKVINYFEPTLTRSRYRPNERKQRQTDRLGRSLSDHTEGKQHGSSNVLKTDHASTSKRNIVPESTFISDKEKSFSIKETHTCWEWQLALSKMNLKDLFRKG